MWTCPTSSRKLGGISVWSELCGMWTSLHNTTDAVFKISLIWTMWDVNVINRPWALAPNMVWSELCGMWTRTIFADSHRLRRRVWSELCGMWTRSRAKSHRFKRRQFDLNYVGCELGGYIAWHQGNLMSLIWTMWDVNVFFAKVLKVFHY